MSEYNLFNKWRVKRKHFWLAIGLGIPALCVVVFGLLILVSPRIGGMSSDSIAYNEDVGYAPAAAYDYDGEYFYDDMEAEIFLEESGDGDFALANSRNQNTTASTSPTAAIDRLIIREGNINIAVEQTRQTRDDIEDIISGLAEKGAYVVSSSENGRGENLEPYINITVRVPVEDFATVMDQIAEMGVEVESRNENSQDVTEEYVDLAGRIEATELSIEQLKGFMEEAEFTADLLEAERELYSRQAELEALKGRLNYLAESAALSIIYVTLTPYELYEPIDTSWKPLATAKQAVEDLFDSMQGFANFMIVFVILVLPWLIFFGLIIWGLVAIVRRRKAKKQAKQTE